MESDVCKHCAHAGCLDVCPTGALLRTEFGTVVVQNDICNGCGYCIPARPYGVIERRDGPPGDPAVGIAQKCTLCYDRLKGDLQPACPKACPTDSIQFGDLDELRERAQARVRTLDESGAAGARLYGDDPCDGVGGGRRVLPAARRAGGLRSSARPRCRHHTPAKVGACQTRPPAGGGVLCSRTRDEQANGVDHGPFRLNRCIRAVPGGI
jgi:Fe-S-cluster-containing dehydrogenase component